MERFKKILNKIFVLPLLLTVLIAIPPFAFVAYVLSAGITGVLSYLSYIVSAYAMILCTTAAPNIAQSILKWIKGHPLTEKIRNLSFVQRFLNDIRFRAEVSLYQGFFINLLYIVMKMVSGIYYRSVWFISLAIYYILLAVMRFLLLRRGKKKTTSNRMRAELRRYRSCGITLLMMNQALAMIVVFMVKQNRGYKYPGFLIYAMAAYSFYSFTVAIINLVKFRKHGSPVLSAAKVINLVAAMVSILSLETAMLSQFGEGDPVFRQTMTAATGGGVCTIVLGMAIFMIWKSSKQMKELQINNSQT